MGEFNVNKSDGSLEQTAGMPSEYPASQVMFSDGVTSVVNAFDALQAWSAEVDVQVADGHFFFSKHPIGLKRIRYALSVSTSEATYSNIIPNDYLPLGSMAIVGYNNNGGLRHAVMYTNKNIIILSSNFAGLFGQQIYT